MSDGLNLVLLIGNLGADPELTQTSAGPVLKMRLATPYTFYDKENKKQTNTEWHSISYFGNGAQGLARILQKGSGVTVEGRNHTSTYEKNGEKRWRTEVIANRVYLTSGRYRDVGAAAPAPESELMPLARTRAPAPEAAVRLADLPF